MISLNLSLLTQSSAPFLRSKTTSLPPRRMENDNNANDKLSSSNQVSRRDLLLSATATAMAAISPIASSSVSSSSFPIKLERTVSRVVSRPRKSRSKQEKEDEEEVLVIQGIEFDSRIPIKFDVYVNDDCSDGGAGPTASEFAGSMVNVPHGRGTIRTSLRLGITDLLEDVGADDDDDVVVTLVPKSGVGLVTIGSIGIHLLS